MTIDPIVLTAHVLPAAGSSFVIIGTASRDLMIPQTLTAWTVLLCIGVFATAIPVVTFFAGLKQIGASRAGIISIAEPPVTVALGAILFTEPVTTATIVGGILILIGVIVLERK